MCCYSTLWNIRHLFDLQWLCHSLLKWVIADILQMQANSARPSLQGCVYVGVDVNECAELVGVCRGGVCKNTFGGFTCTCPPGYQLDRTKHVCAGTVFNITQCSSVVSKTIKHDAKWRLIKMFCVRYIQLPICQVILLAVKNKNRWTVQQLHSSVVSIDELQNIHSIMAKCKIVHVSRTSKKLHFCDQN